MKILVTGATGFAGRALIAKLAGHNHEVTALARDASPSPSPKVRTLVADLLDLSATADTLRDECFGAVVHAAAVTPAATVGIQQPQVFESNITLTFNLLNALDALPGRIIHLSTLDVYAPPTGDAILSETSPIAPLSLYARSKLKTEELCREWAQSHAVPCITARLTQVFGPGDSSQKFIPNVLRSIGAGSRIELYGDGSDLRDFLFVEDAAALLAALIENGNACGVFNVASGTSRSLNDVIRTLSGITGREFVVEHRPRRKALVNYRFNIEKLNAATHDTPLSNFTTALERTLRGLANFCLPPSSARSFDK